MFSIEANTKNVLNISANNHKKLLHITKNIIAKMNLNNELNNIDYFKLKNIRHYKKFIKAMCLV